MAGDARRWRRWWSIPALLLMLVWLSRCDFLNLVPAGQRATELAAPGDSIRVGLAWPGRMEGFLRGAELARREINQAGGLLQRPLEFLVLDDTVDGTRPDRVARRVSQSFAARADLVAVIGHYLAEVTVPAALTYEQAGIVFLAGWGPRASLTRPDFRYIFRTLPGSTLLGRQQAIFAHGRGWRRVAILETRESWAEELASAFEIHAIDLKTEIVFRRSFFADHRDFREILADLGAFPLDGIFLGSGGESAVSVIRQARELGMDTPILVGDFVDLEEMLERLGEHADRVFVPVIMDPGADDPQVRQFVASYRADFGQTPDDTAAQGYDSVRLLAHAIESSRSTVPLVVANTLRFTTSWRGVTGRHAFRRNGDIYTKTVGFALFRDARIHYLDPAD